MQVEQDNLSLSASPFLNEFSHQDSQSLPGSRLVGRNVVTYTENPDPNAYILFGYHEHSDSPVDYTLRALNDPLANTGTYSALYSQPAHQITEDPPAQMVNDMNPMANGLSDPGNINYTLANDTRSGLAFSYAHRSSQHPNTNFLSRSDENTGQSFSHHQNSIPLNSFESDNCMTRSTVRNSREQAPPDTSLLSRVGQFTPPWQSPKRGRKLAHGASQGKPSETDQERECKARKVRGSARKGKNHAELQSCRIAKRKPSKKPALKGKQYLHHKTIAGLSLWLSQNSEKMPSELIMSCLSTCFGSSIEPIRDWFRQNVTVSLEDEDTGYQTMRASKTDIASLYRGNRGCERKATSIGVRAVTSRQVPRNESRPFACTSRCPQSFKEKGNWERHEEKNRVQRVWICSFQGCKNKEARKRVWLNRKEHFHNHISNHHPGLGITPRDIKNCYVELESNFDKHCIFSSCNEIFHSWKQRINHIGEHFRLPWDMSEWRDMDEEEKDTDTTDASDDESGDSEFDDMGNESDSDDTEDGAPGFGPSKSSHNHGADRLGGHHGSSAQQPGSNNHHSRSRDGASAASTNYDWVTYECQADPSISVNSIQSLTQHTVKSGNLSSGSPPARSSLLTRSHALILPSVAASSMQIHPLRFLGRGSSAIVDEVKMEGCGVRFARKRILCYTQDQKRSILREVMIMARLKHPHVIRFVASYQQMNSINYLLRPVADCNLLQYMSGQHSSLDYRSRMQRWFSCLASGLQYLHNSGVRHRDIKPSNMLLRDDRILYTDFGSSNMIPDDDSSESESADFTERYAAPEVFRGRRGRAADVFALGCVYIEIFAFLLPSGPDMSIVQAQCKAMTEPRPEQRPTAAEIARRIPALVCCEEELDIITRPKAASGPNLRLAPPASDRTVAPRIWDNEVTSSTAVLASTSHSNWHSANPILEGISEGLLRTENEDPALRKRRQHGIKKRKEEEKLKENVISEKRKRLKSMTYDGITDVPLAVPLLVNSSDDGTLSDSSCTTVPPREINGPSRSCAGLEDSGPTMRVGSSSTLELFLKEENLLHECLLSGNDRTGEMRRRYIHRLFTDVRIMGVD